VATIEAIEQLNFLIDISEAIANGNGFILAVHGGARRMSMFGEM
jgi:hypothetical protein